MINLPDEFHSMAGGVSPSDEMVKEAIATVEKRLLDGNLRSNFRCGNLLVVGVSFDGIHSIYVTTAYSVKEIWGDR